MADYYNSPDQQQASSSSYNGGGNGYYQGYDHGSGYRGTHGYRGGRGGFNYYRGGGGNQRHYGGGEYANGGGYYSTAQTGGDGGGGDGQLQPTQEGTAQPNHSYPRRYSKRGSVSADGFRYKALKPGRGMSKKYPEYHILNQLPKEPEKPFKPRSRSPSPPPLLGMSINELNEDCMNLIFRQISMQELIRVRRSCQWFNDVILRMFAAKTSVKIFGSKEDVFSYLQELPKFNLQRFDDFVLRPSGLRDDDIIAKSPASLKVIAGFFPKLKKMLICNYSSSWQQFLPETLRELPTIESLTFFGAWSSKDLPRDFWKTIFRQLPYLRELHLFDMEGARLVDELPWHKLPALEKFTLTDYNFYLGNVLQNLNSTRMKHLRLWNSRITPDQFRLSLEATHMNERITHLTIGPCETEQGDPICYRLLMSVIGRYLKNLVSLDILDYREVRLLDLTSQLVPDNLPKLRELSLFVGMIEPDVHFQNVYVAPALTQVKRLYVKDCTCLTAEQFCAYFPRLFPNIIFLQFESLIPHVLDGVEKQGVFSLFRHLQEYKPIKPKLGMSRKEKLEEYSFAGRHMSHFRQHMNRTLPLADRAEDDHDEILNCLYDEGRGEDEGLLDAVFA